MTKDIEFDFQLEIIDLASVLLGSYLLYFLYKHV